MLGQLDGKLGLAYDRRADKENDWILFTYFCGFRRIPVRSQKYLAFFLSEKVQLVFNLNEILFL